MSEHPLLQKLTSLKESWIIFFLFLTSLAVNFAALRFLGARIGMDSVYYTDSARLLMESGFNFMALWAIGFPPYYWAYPTILALFNNSAMGLIVLQIILQALATVLIYSIGKRVFSQLAGLLSALIYIFLFEVFQWHVYVLTDSLFIFLIIAIAYFYTLYRDDRKSFVPYALWGTVLFTLFLRPTAAPLLAALLLAFSQRWKPVYRNTVLVLGGIGLVALIVYGLSQEKGAHWGLSGYLHYFVSMFEDSIIVRDRPSFRMALEWSAGVTLQNILQFFGIFFARLAAFWSPLAPEFSFSHKLLNIFTLLPLFLFGAWGMFATVKKFTWGKLTQTPAFFFMALIGTFWIFQGLTEVDYDWRYRVPVLPFMALFAGFAAASFLEGPSIKRLLHLQVVRFFLVGCLNAAVDYAILNAFYLLFHFSLFWAVFWGFVAGGLTGYFLHSRWTFQYDTQGRELHKLSHFLFISLVGLSLTEGIVHLLTGIYGFHYNVSKTVALVIAVAWSFSANKWWVFRKKPAPAPDHNVLQ